MELAKKLARKFKRFFVSDFSQSNCLVQKIGAEMRKNTKSGRAGVYVPNYYNIQLPQAELSTCPEEIKRKVKNIIRAEVDRNNFKLYNNLKVEFNFSKQNELAIKSRFKLKNTESKTTETATKVFTSTSSNQSKCDKSETVKIDGGLSPVGYLELNQGKREDEFELQAVETNIGRQKNNEITIMDKSVSRVHAQVIDKDCYFVIRDLDSTNGVLVNGEFVKERQLSDGDKIKLGEVELFFKQRPNGTR